MYKNISQSCYLVDNLTTPKGTITTIKNYDRFVKRDNPLDNPKIAKRDNPPPNKYVVDKGQAVVDEIKRDNPKNTKRDTNKNINTNTSKSFNRLNISQSCYYQQHREIPRERRGLWKCITANIL